MALAIITFLFDKNTGCSKIHLGHVGLDAPVSCETTSELSGPGQAKKLVGCQIEAKGIIIKHMATQRMPELTDEGQKKKRKLQNIQIFKFIACGSIPFKSCL